MKMRSLLTCIALLSSFAWSAPATKEITRLDTFAKRDLAASLATKLSSDASVLFPQSKHWENITERWDKYLPPTFQAAVQVATEEDIVSVIKYAVSQNLSFFTQGGGHGFSPLNTVQNAIMINMRQLNQVNVDAHTGIATVGGGIVYEEVINASYAAGREITVGSCPCAGLLGASLGGGIGRLQGLHGLTQDAIRRLRVVLGNGDVINVSENEHSDLWWGMRGAGHNFGVVVEAEFQTAPQASAGQFYNVDITYADAKLEQVLELMNKQIVNQPAELAIEIIFAANPTTLKPVIAVNIVYAGTQSAGQKWSSPWKQLGPLTFTEDSYNWAELPFKSEGGMKSGDCLNYGYKDIYSANLKFFDPPTMRSIYTSFGKLIAANPNANASSIIFEVYSQEGVRSSPDNGSAFPNRSHFNVLALIFGWWTDTAITYTVDTWLANAQSAMNKTSGYDKQYIYQNYAKSEIVQSYYGYEPWRLERLKSLKEKYDPKALFSGYHPIPV